MKEQTEQNINEAIDWLQQTGSSLQDFAVEQAPLYCQEVLTIHLIGGLLMAIIPIPILIFSVWGTVKFCRKSYEKPYDFYEVNAFICGLTAAVCVVVSPIGAYKASKTQFAPRVVIMEHLKKQL